MLVRLLIERGRLMSQALDVSKGSDWRRGGKSDEEDEEGIGPVRGLKLYHD